MASRNISLANKCQLLFGLALLLVLAAALSVPWFRMQRVVERGQYEIADQLADAWAAGLIQVGVDAPETSPSGLEFRLLPLAAAKQRAASDPFFTDFIARCESAPKESIPGGRRAWDPAGQTLKYRYLRAVFESDLEAAAVPNRGAIAQNPSH